MSEEPAKYEVERKHERRVVSHASGWKEQTDECVCGKPWPCPELTRPAEPPRAIQWSDVQRPNDRCSYTHLIGETPFGRILITWKGWKEPPNMTLDESPWGATGYVGETVERAKQAVESEFSRRLTLCVPEQSDDLEHAPHRLRPWVGQRVYIIPISDAQSEASIESILRAQSIKFWVDGPT